MKLVRFSQDKDMMIGIRKDSTVTKIKIEDPDTKDGLNFADILDTAACGSTKEVKRKINNLKGNVFNIEDINLLPPIAKNARMICLGGVYPSHLRESGTDLNTVPAQWIVPDTAVIGTNAPIMLDERVADAVEPAVELGVVIGTGGKNIPETDVYNHIAGLTVVNDVTARTEWPGPRGHKIMDNFNPCGPHVMTYDSFDNEPNLQLSIKQGKEEICKGSTSGQRFTLSFIVSFLSSIFPLRSGDVISTGDPGGIEDTLTPGQIVTAEVESVGTLQNPVKMLD